MKTEAERSRRPLNDFQRVAADSYAGGEYAYVNSVEDSATMGDTFFTSGISDLDDAESWDQAAERVSQSIRDLEQVLDGLHAKGAEAA